MGLIDRLAGAPISWGVCEVPGWGAELPKERVLREMAAIGLRATELGSDGYLPVDPEALRTEVGSYGLEMIGGFVPLVLHESSQEQATIDAAIRAAKLMSGAGGRLFVTAAVTTWDWAPRTEVDALAWRQFKKMYAIVDEIVGEYDMVQALHPHLNTIVEADDDVQRVLDLSEVGWTLDTGHLQIGGTDPVWFAEHAFDRVRHVHLKDVRIDLAAPVAAGRQSIMEGVQAGMFCNLGQGDVAVRDVVVSLESAGYADWYVLEQDAALTDGLPAEGCGPILDVQASIEYLRSVETDLSSSRSGGGGMNIDPDKVMHS